MLAEVLGQKANIAECEQILRETLPAARAEFQNGKLEAYLLADALHNFAVTRRAQGNSKEAEELLREAVKIREANLPKEHFLTALAKSALGENLTTQKRFDEAEPLLTESYESLKVLQGEQNPRTILAKLRLDEFYGVRNKITAAK